MFCIIYMKHSDFLHLEEKLKEQSFNTSYKTTNILLSIFSYLGNFISIFLAFFFLFSIITVGISNIYVAGILSVLLLSGLELFKRDIFGKFSMTFLKNINKVKNYVVLMGFSLLLIFMSFYSTLSGAQIFSSKSDEIITNNDIQINNYSDSIKNYYLPLNNNLTIEIKTYKSKFDLKEDEQLAINKKLQEKSFLTGSEKERNIQLTNEKKELNNFISKNEYTINSNIKTQDSLIKNYVTQINNKSKTQITKNSNDSLIFIIFSTLIELVILLGVFFGVYYNTRSYNEHKKEIEYDPIFQKWFTYNELLKIILPKNIKINQRIQTLNSIIDMCKINNIYVDKSEIESFLKLCTNIGIITQKGSYRYVMKQHDISEELLKEHFKIQ